jgi:hypothetical protein
MTEAFHGQLVEEALGFQSPNLPHLELLTRCMTYHGRNGPYEYIFVLVRDCCLLLAPVGSWIGGEVRGHSYG